MKGRAGRLVDAKEYLEQIEKLDLLIEHKQTEKKGWQDIARNITVPMGREKVQASGDQQKMETAVVNYVALEQEIDLAIIQFAIEKQKIIRTLEQLPTLSYKVLYMKYVEYKEYPYLHDIADEFGRSDSWASDQCKIAIDQLQEILNKSMVLA